MKQFVCLFAVAGIALGIPTSSRAQTLDNPNEVFQPPTLVELIQSSPHILFLQVEKADRDKRIIQLRKLNDLKGNDRAGRIQHEIRFSDRESRAIFAWARPGKKAICFHDGESSQTCLGNFWYWSDVRKPALWEALYVQSRHPATYIGSVEKLREHVTAIQEGKEVTITAWPRDEELSPSHGPAYRDWLRGKKGPVCRIKVGLKIDLKDFVDLEGTPYFVGWGIGGTKVIPGLIAGLGHKDSRVRAESAEDLGQLRPFAKAAIPDLKKALNDPDGYVRVFVAEALKKIDRGNEDALPVLVKALDARDGELREAAADALATLGIISERAVPALAKAILQDKEPRARRVAAFALGRICPEGSQAGSRPQDVAPILGKVLQKDRDRETRAWAVRTLRLLGPWGKGALPGLRAALIDETVSHDAADVLSRLGPDGMAPLIAALKDENHQVPELLGDMGSKARPAIPALRRLLKHNEPTLRLEAAKALIRIDRKEAASAGPALQELLTGNYDSEEKKFVIYALAKSQLEAFLPASDYVKALATALADKPNAIGLRVMAIKSLGRLGASAKPAVPVLQAHLKDQTKIVRVAAAKALWDITHRAEPSVDTLIEFIGGNGEGIEELGEIGPKAARALPALRKAMRKKDAQCAVAFWRIAGRAKVGELVSEPRREALSILVAMAKDPQPMARVDAARALVAIGQETEEIVPVLIDVVKGKDFEARFQAICVLETIRPEARAAVPALRAHFSDPSVPARFHAASAVCRIDPRNNEALRAMIRFLTPFPRYRENAAEVLERLGPHARAAVPALIRALTDEDRGVYLAAGKALRAIDPETADKMNVP